ncbi:MULTISPECIES: YdcF family protein [unclassified Rhodococcus (in: high G+C Gram-positive bacteria)]|uniref:SanA/YdcF family protein n=1 Tax=Rhodococcus TaxID=1827 RepID=UPI00193BE0DE|nr:MULTISPECIES: YdcF family protein [unclassified Rhodococcus (in: high G+C Gram-positive bacteria)]QRI76862.1 YdcF family protein [Rhodococcus aetherivorans]QSE60279.1 YdcF family protein [Rhodococcus sp. PSBB066]QSE68415.1 YdcF family protein [Rhodococcus sp. PSBB049]
MRTNARWWRTVTGTAIGVAGGTLALAGVSARVAAPAAGRLYTLADAPTAPVVIVPGARVRNGWPMPMLRGRLDVAVALLADGRARSVLVSGDAGGRSGDEIAAMTGYLVAHGVGREVIATDPYGLDTYDTCHRAAQVYGVTTALIATQDFHLPRAVALGRRAGIDMAGVVAGCDCRLRTRVRNVLREYLLSRPKALVEMHFPRPPRVGSATDGTSTGILA